MSWLFYDSKMPGQGKNVKNSLFCTLSIQSPVRTKGVSDTSLLTLPLILGLRESLCVVALLSVSIIIIILEPCSVEVRRQAGQQMNPIESHSFSGLL